jgi:hypothetical protein
VALEATKVATICVGALFAASLSAVAWAAPPLNTPSNDFTPQSGAIGPQPPHKNLQWDARTGRWGLDLEMPQQTYNSDQWGSTRIGVHYRVGTSFRVGPSVQLAPEQTPDGRTLYQQQPAPRVRLETSLKF